MFHQIDKPLMRRIPRHFGEFHFCFRHPLPCRGLESRRRNGIFTGQFLVCEPPSKRGARSFDEPTTIISLTFIVSKCLLVKVAEKMERFDADVGSLDTALQQRPEILNALVCTLPSTYFSAWFTNL